MTLRTLSIVALVVGAGAATLGSQGRGFPPGGTFGGQGGNPAAPQRPGDDTPVFRGGVTAVQVDVFVTDAAGNPVTDLTQDDFEIREAGGRRDIVSFASITLPIEPAPAAADDTGAEPDVRTNAKPPGRTYLIALDEVNPDRALRARAFLRTFVNQYVGPDDVAAVALTGRGLADSGQDFTNNKRLLLTAIDKWSGTFSAFDEPGDKPVTGWDRQLASSLRNLTEFLATMPGRKALLFVGESLSGIDAFDVKDYNGGALTPAAIDAHAAIAAATRGNVTIYPVDPRGLTTLLTEAESFDPVDLTARSELTAIADLTGGFAIAGTNNLPAAFERMVRENSVYYTIGFSSEYRRRDGRYVSVDVRVKRPGLQVRSRGGYVAPLGAERRPERVESEARLPVVADAIASPVSSSGVRMRVFAAPYRANGDRSSIALVVEVDPSTLTLPVKSGLVSGDIEVSFLATDAKGKTRPGRRHPVNVAFKPEAAARAGYGLRMISEIELPDGRYQLRVAAGSRAAAGSVVYDLEVPDFREDQIAMSGLSLTSTAAARVSTFRPRDPLGDLLPGPPTASREFSRDETIVLFGEIYDNRRDAADGDIDIATTLLGTDGTIAALTDTRQDTRARAPGARGFTVALPLKDVAAGSYVLRVDARSRSDAEHTASRSIPLVVK